MQEKSRKKAIDMIVEGMNFFRPSTEKPVPLTMENRAGIILDDLMTIVIAELMPFETLSQEDKHRLIDQLTNSAILGQITSSFSEERKKKPDLLDLTYQVIEGVMRFNSNSRDDYHDLSDRERDQVAKDTINTVFESVCETYPYSYEEQEQGGDKDE